MIEAIIKTLHNAFSTYKIYTENVEQGLKTPCFSILPLKVSGNRHLQNRHKHTHQFMVQYFPKGKDTYAECSMMLPNLLLLLADVGNYHAIKLSGEIVDGVLHFEAVYTDFIDVDVDDSEDMAEYNLTERVI